MITLSLTSKRFNCKLELKEKVTFVLGNSGSGKTETIRRLSSNASSKKVDITDGFSYEILTSTRFNDICNNALKYISHENKIDSTNFNSLDDTRKKKYYCNYWENTLNFPFSKSIIIIDDEDFVDSVEFQAFFDCDKSNYYLIINRLHLNRIGYSVSEVYDYKTSGVDHYLEKRYNLQTEENNDRYDYVITEGIGSDYIYFKSWLGDKVINPTFNNKLESGGRTNVAKMIDKNRDIFRYKTIFILIDYVAFGSNFESLLNICNEISANFYIKSSYKSFEYLLLKSNLILDNNLDDFVNDNRLKFNSLETLYTYRLKELTKGTLLSYKKKADEFSLCYYKNCCSNNNYRSSDCDLRKKFYKKDKFEKMLKDTEFSDFLELVDKVE